MARFVDTFARVLGDPALPHLFFVDGGALAVENALKVAFDWKSRWNEAHGIDPALGTKVLHLQRRVPRPQRLHDVADQHRPEQGRAVPEVRLAADRRALPSVDGPPTSTPPKRESLGAARAAFEAHPHDIACFIAEPIQGEGGDRHFRPEFFAAMQALCRRVRRAVRLGRGADRLRPDRHRLGLPAVRRRARRRRVRQEDAGLRRDGRRPGRRGARQRVRGQLADQLHLGRQPHRHGAVPGASSR